MLALNLSMILTWPLPLAYAPAHSLSEAAKLDGLPSADALELPGHVNEL